MVRSMNNPEKTVVPTIEAITRNEFLSGPVSGTLGTIPFNISIAAAYKAKEEVVGPEVIRQFEKAVMLQNLDSHWKEHLAAMDHLRQGIHLRSYGQKNPKQEYKRESFELFSEMLEALKVEVVTILSKVQVKAQEDVEAVEEQRRQADETPKNFEHESKSEPEQPKSALRDGPKVGRNDACPCGSGKKYKQCHGKLS